MMRVLSDINALRVNYRVIAYIKNTVDPWVTIDKSAVGDVRIHVCGVNYPRMRFLATAV